jgi:hypothetical protein
VKRVGVVIAVVTALVVGAFLLVEARGPEPPDLLMCPASESARTFGDVRDLCASRATALAGIDGSGGVTYFTDPAELPCSLPAFRALDQNTTSVIGQGGRRCDTDAAGMMLFAFPHCSLTTNYPGTDEYRAALPIGLLVEPYDC